MKLIILAALVLSCGHIKPINKNNKAKEEIKKLKKLENTFANVPKSITLKPGKVEYVTFDTNLKNGKYVFNCPARSISFAVKSGKVKVYLIESYFSSLKKEVCHFLGKAVFSLNKKEFPYKREKLNVDKRRVFLNKKDLARVIKERDIKRKMYEKSQNYYIFDSRFRVPLNSFITSYYGNKRLFNNKKETQHLGNDLRAAVGVPIPATNTGQVVYTGNLFYSGNIVVIDHGLEIFSIYGHLSDIKVKEGDIVQKGNIVGLAGATGRVSGPHLHWGMRVQGQWVDGFSLVEESKKQFSRETEI